MEIVKEADITAPPSKVYEYLLDFSRHPEWTTPDHNVRITSDSAGPTVVGSKFTSDAHQFGAQHDRLEVTELIPDRRIVYQAVMKDGNTMRHTFELVPSGAGTHLSKRFETLKLNLVSKLTLPLAKLVAPKSVAGDVARIKANLEQSAPS